MEPVTGRQYKSRKVRPCDFCRKRKVACHMETAPPCQMCRQRQQPCTFARGPGTRTRPTPSNVNAAKGGRQGRDRALSTTASAGFEITTNINSSGVRGESQGISQLKSPRFEASITEQTQVELSEVLDGYPEESSGVGNTYDELPHGLDPTMTHSTEDPFGIFDYDFQHGNFDRFQSPGLRGNHGKTASITSHRREDHGLRPPITGSEDTITGSIISGGSKSQTITPRDSIEDKGPPRTLNSDVHNGLFKCSLENLSGASSRFIGFTGELDLYLLRHRQYDDLNRSTSQYTSVIYQRMETVPNSQTSASDGRKDDYMPPQVFAIMEDIHTDRAEPRLDAAVTEQNSQEFRHLISDEVAVNLVRLYYRFVDPYFPILSRSQFPREDEDLAINSMPISLLAALCATAIPFIIYDDILCVQLPRAPSVTHLFRISWLAITQELHTPRLSTIQACLLLLQRHATDRYVADSPFKWTLMSITVGVAQNLGLNRDPTGWDSVAPWERKLRRRLWWAIWITEKWTALGQGMPTHLHEADCDVKLLTAEDFEGQKESNDTSGLSLHFYNLMTLTVILNDIVETYYTVRGVRNTASNFELSLELAKTARAKLKDWHDKLPLNLRRRSRLSGHSERNFGSIADLDGNGALHLAYIVTQMTLFRALLRPINNISAPNSNSSGTSFGVNYLQSDGAQAVATGAITCIRELVEFIESLTGIDWDAFWHSWSRHNFAIASTFLMQLLVIIKAGQAGVSSVTTPLQVLQSDLLASQQQEPSSPDTVQNARLDIDDQYKQLQDLVQRWRWAMRVSARGAGGNKGLMDLSLLRIDALFTEWQANNSKSDSSKDVNTK